MKKVIIGDHNERLLATLETILKHWGYRVLATSNPSKVQAFLEQIEPNMIILGTSLLSDSPPELSTVLGTSYKKYLYPIIVLGAEDSRNSLQIPHETLDVPVDIFGLFGLIQRHLENIPRKHLRLPVKLPSILYRDEGSHLAEVLSLSSEGLFIKTSFRLHPGDQLQVIIPLIGLKQELELDGKVLYNVLPEADNNYLQGVGVEFTDLDQNAREDLQAFIEKLFLGEIRSTQPGLDDLDPAQLHSHLDKVTARLKS